MTLPAFLGIGVQRGGTTWLHTVLASHPDVYMPARRKEIRYFDRDYERGLGYYEAFFCPPEQAARYRAIGEISPQYYHCDECPERIFTTLPKSKLIIMLRHPVSRAYSNYGFWVQRWNYRGTFEEFIAERPRMLEWGYYSRYLKRYLRYFDRTQILALIFEDTFVNVYRTKKELANFLAIDVDKFPTSNSKSKVNASTVPTHQSLYSLVTRTALRLKKRRLHRVVDLVRRLGVEQVLRKGNPLPPLDQDLKQQLSLSYQDEFDELEQVMQIDLSSWRQHEEVRTPVKV